MRPEPATDVSPEPAVYVAHLVDRDGHDHYAEYPDGAATGAILMPRHQPAPLGVNVHRASDAAIRAALVEATYARFVRADPAESDDLGLPIFRLERRVRAEPICGRERRR